VQQVCQFKRDGGGKVIHFAKGFMTIATHQLS